LLKVDTGGQDVVVPEGCVAAGGEGAYVVRAGCCGGGIDDGRGGEGEEGEE
jgi:hypothetical protein